MKRARRTVRGRWLLLLAAAFAVVAALCLWKGASGSHIQGAYFTEDASAPAAAGDGHGGGSVLWFVAAGASFVAGATAVWCARRG